MSAVLAPPGSQPSTPSTSGAVTGPTPRQFLIGYAWTLLAPVIALTALLVGWTAVHATGWPAAIAAVAGWSMAVGVWLRRRGWPAAGAHLVSWALPAALHTPLAVLGLLSADRLVLWGPVSAVLAVAVTVVHEPGLAGPRDPFHR